MLQFRPRVRQARNSDQLTADVETPGGETFAIDDPALVGVLRARVDPKHELTLMRGEQALTDAYPISIFSLQTVRQLGAETGATWDKRRFRANVYLDAPDLAGFGEDALVGRSLRIGRDVVVAVAKRDVRCMMITLDPDTAERAPALLKNIAQRHEGAAGVYGSVLTEGVIRKGDAVEVLA